MDSIFTVLFSQRNESKCLSIYLLVIRILLGYLLLQHAYFKLMGYDSFTPIYLDAFGVGVSRPMAAVLSFELFCGISLIFGFFIRIFILPMLLVSVYFIYLGIHLEEYMYSELSVLYLMVLLLIYWLGAGKYSVDYVAHRWIKL